MMMMDIIPSDVPSGPLDTNVASDHLQINATMLQLTRYPDMWTAISEISTA